MSDDRWKFWRYLAYTGPVVATGGKPKRTRPCKKRDPSPGSEGGTA